MNAYVQNYRHLVAGNPEKIGLAVTELCGFLSYLLIVFACLLRICLINQDNFSVNRVVPFHYIADKCHLMFMIHCVLLHDHDDLGRSIL